MFLEFLYTGRYTLPPPPPNEMNAHQMEKVTSTGPSEHHNSDTTPTSGFTPLKKFAEFRNLFPDDPRPVQEGARCDTPAIFAHTRLIILAQRTGVVDLFRFALNNLVEALYILDPRDFCESIGRLVELVYEDEYYQWLDPHEGDKLKEIVSVWVTWNIEILRRGLTEQLKAGGRFVLDFTDLTIRRLSFPLETNEVPTEPTRKRKNRRKNKNATGGDGESVATQEPRDDTFYTGGAVETVIVTEPIAEVEGEGQHSDPHPPHKPNELAPLEMNIPHPHPSEQLHSLEVDTDDFDRHPKKESEIPTTPVHEHSPSDGHGRHTSTTSAYNPTRYRSVSDVEPDLESERGEPIMPSWSSQPEVSISVAAEEEERAYLEALSKAKREVEMEVEQDGISQADKAKMEQMERERERQDAVARYVKEQAEQAEQREGEGEKQFQHVNETIEEEIENNGESLSRPDFAQPANDDIDRHVKTHDIEVDSTVDASPATSPTPVPVQLTPQSTVTTSAKKKTKKRKKVLQRLSLPHIFSSSS